MSSTTIATPASASATAGNRPNKPTKKLLTMDVIELTIFLKAIGFRLDSIDYNAQRFSGGKISHIKSDEMMASPTLAAKDSNFISVDISCGKSKIISRLSYKLNNNDQMTSTSSGQCTCPQKESIAENSFWEIQSSGSFANQRRPLNGANKKNENGIDNDTSSNMLPVLSEKSISMTQVLAQVILNQYQNDIQFGEATSAKHTDIKSIIEALGIKSSTVAEQKPALNAEDLNLETPLSSMNVTPTDDKDGEAAATGKPEIYLNVAASGEAFQTRNMALEDTVNTEAFTSPKDDMFTSSPNGDDKGRNLPTIERDANIIHNLNQARHFVDATLLLMKLNVTRNLSQDSSTLLTVTPHLPNNIHVSRFNMPTFPTTITKSSTKSAPNAMNARIVTPTLSLGNRGRKLPIPINSAESSRSNSSVSSIGRPTVISKLASMKRAVTNVANRTVGSTSTARSSLHPANGTTKSRLTPSSTIASRRSSGVAMNLSSLATLNTASPGLSARRSVGNIKPLKTSSNSAAKK